MPAIVLTWDGGGERTGRLYHGTEIIKARRDYRRLLLADRHPRVEKPHPGMKENGALPMSSITSPASPKTLKEFRTMSATAIKKSLSAKAEALAKKVTKAKTTTRKATKPA
jgi:hypothetical protein